MSLVRLSFVVVTLGGTAFGQDGCALLGERIYNAMAGLRQKPDDKQELVAAKERITTMLVSLNAPLVCTPDPKDPAAQAELGKITQQYVAAEASRKMVDLQSGAGSSSSGSTTAVAGGSVPQFLSFATESGGVTQKVDGTTVTVRVNPVKLANALRTGFGETPLPPNDPGYKALSRLNFAFTTDRSRAPSATTTGGLTLTERFKQVTDVSLRIDLRNDQDPFSRNAIRRVNSLVASQTTTVLHQAADALGNKLFGQISSDELAKLQADREELAIRLASSAKSDKAEVIKMVKEGVLAIHSKHFKSINATQELIDFGAAILDFKTKQNQIADEIAHGFVATVDLNWKRPPLTTATMALATGTAPTAIAAMAVAQAPNLYTAQLILSSRLIGKSQGTATFSTSFFERKVGEMKGVWRDASAGGKWSIPMGSLKSGRTSIHFSVLYQHLHQKPLGIDLLVNDVKVNKPGNIGLFQAQYRIDMGDSGVSIPISFTASNRTELVKEKELRGNIGISFDLSKLMGTKTQ